MTRVLAWPIAFALTLSACGCATLFSSSRTTVAVRSEPAGAEVWIGGTLRATTPCTLSITPGRQSAIELRKSGHRSQTYFLRSSGIQPTWLYLDLLAPIAVGGVGFGVARGLLLGLVGVMFALPVSSFNVLIDALTGDWKTQPSDLDATLQPDSLAGAKP